MKDKAQEVEERQCEIRWACSVKGPLFILIDFQVCGLLVLESVGEHMLYVHVYVQSSYFLLIESPWE